MLSRRKKHVHREEVEGKIFLREQEAERKRKRMSDDEKITYAWVINICNLLGLSAFKSYLFFYNFSIDFLLVFFMYEHILSALGAMAQQPKEQ